MSALPRWSEDRFVPEAEEAVSADAPFRTAGRVDAPLPTVALVQSRVPPQTSKVAVGVATALAAIFAGFYAAGIWLPLGLIVAPLTGWIALRMMLNHRLVVRAGPEGVEVVQTRPDVRHFIARKKVRELSIAADGAEWRLDAIETTGERRPLIIAPEQKVVVALAEKIAAHLGLRRQ